MTLLSRYDAGEHEEVWGEMYPRYWKEVQQEPFYSEALAVARATMTRVRDNIITIVSRLESIGYRFGYDWIEEDRKHFPDAGDWAARQPPVLSLPLPDVQERLHRLQDAGLSLPISLCAWYEIIGAVNFVGTPPTSWGRRWYSTDPLRVDPLDDYIIAECLEEKRLCIAPDEYFKYFTSGGGPYYVDLKFPSTDKPIHGS